MIALLLLMTTGCTWHMKENESKETGNTLSKEYTGLQSSFFLPEQYQQVKTKTEEIAMLFKSSNSTVRVFRQKLGEKLSANSYIEYGNKQLYEGKAGFTVLENKTRKIRGATIREIGYKRPPLMALAKDENYYMEVHLINKKEDDVLTFWGKTDEANYDSLKNDLKKAVLSVERKQEITNDANVINNTNKTSSTNINAAAAEASLASPHIKYSGKQLELEILPNKLVWGRFYPGVPFDEECIEKMLASEKKLEHKFEFIMTYKTFPGGGKFPEEAIKRLYEDERVLMLTLQPFTKELDWIAVLEIINGQHDSQIKEWAEGLKRIGEPVFVRPINEMNGDWDPWCAWFFGKDTDLYIQAWRHMVDLFREAGADNVLFVWNPHDRSYPNFQWNNAHLYYPGDDYVDWIGLTGYNNGTSHPGDVWREFDEIYKPLYTDYLQHYPDKPFMITEFSCNEVGGDKAKWIEKAMASLVNNYPNLKIATWFDNRDNAWLYQLDSTPEAFAAFQKGLKNYGYLKKAIGIRQPPIKTI